MCKLCDFFWGKKKKGTLIQPLARGLENSRQSLSAFLKSGNLKDLIRVDVLPTTNKQQKETIILSDSEDIEDTQLITTNTNDTHRPQQKLEGVDDFAPLTAKNENNVIFIIIYNSIYYILMPFKKINYIYIFMFQIKKYCEGGASAKTTDKIIKNHSLQIYVSCLFLFFRYWNYDF